MFRVESRITSRRVFLVYGCFWQVDEGQHYLDRKTWWDFLIFFSLELGDGHYWTYSLGRNAYFLPIHNSNVLFLRYSVIQKTLTYKITWIKECLLNNIFVKPTFFFNIKLIEFIKLLSYIYYTANLLTQIKKHLCYFLLIYIFYSLPY